MKRFIVLLIVLLMVVVLSVACFSGNVHSEKNQEVQEEVAGSYHVFYVSSDKKYLSFLENFDETKFEIVDISHGHSYWYVTYKDIEN